MLSIENPQPDPPCPCQFPQFNSSSHEKASHNKQLPLPEVVDLPNPSPLHHHQQHTPLPSFSIRDYVFTSRSKDIKKNWPFSLKNLQLCLKHGVKDVLPPFQALDSARNQSFKTCAVDTSSLEKQKTNTSSFDLIEPSRPDLRVVRDSSHNTRLTNKLAETSVHINSCRSGEENDFPSTTTSVSQSEIESGPDNRYSRTPSETDNLLKPVVEVEAEPAAACGSHKTESNPRLSGKKCKLIVKFGGNSDRNSIEDIASNCTTLSETMASKVCPVCKTFSSSSNTTLNAHIDQCLSVESTPKWTADSKLARHRIKPRKTRLMEDIYDTAPHCTLEELDRRNGTSWATISGLRTDETEKITSNEGKKQKVSIHPDDAGDVGPVYIDANGTKLRILSKFNDAPSASKGGHVIGARKLSKAGKYISKKKRKKLAQKHHKYLKLAPQSKKILSRKAHRDQICGGQEGSIGEGRNCEKEHEMPKLIKSKDSGSLRPWVCSKRRGFKKKIAGQEGRQPVRCKWHLPQDLLLENDQSLLDDSLVEINTIQKSADLTDNLMSSAGNNHRMDRSLHKAQVSSRRDCSPARKRVGSFSVGTRISDCVERFCPPMKLNANQLPNGRTSNHDSSRLGLSGPTWNQECPQTRRVIDVHEDAVDNPDIPSTSGAKSSRKSREIVSKAMRFSSFRKNVLSAGGKSLVTESRKRTAKKCSTFKKSHVNLMTERDEDVMAWDSQFDQQYALMHGHVENKLGSEETTREVSLGSSNILETRQASGLCLSQRGEALALMDSQSGYHHYNHDEEINLDSSVRDDDVLHKIDYLESARKQTQVGGEDIVIGPLPKAAGGRFASSLTKSVDIECYGLSSSPKAQSNSLRSIEDYRGLLCETEAPTGPTNPDFVNHQEMFAAYEVGNGMIRQNANMEVELDSEAGQGNFFPEVDPIPIPGPPGSFLPSPRDMGSDDFQGNSSLTTSRIHSSPDQQDIVDGDSSDSPISAASTISNIAADRSDFKYSEPLSSAGPRNLQDRIMFGFTAAAHQATCTGVERTVLDGQYVKVDRISIARGSLSSKIDQPCCCQRKERFSQVVALNHQESQLLRRRTMSSAAIGKQMGSNWDPSQTHMEGRSELIPPASFPVPGPEMVVLPISKPPVGHPSLMDSPKAGGRFSVHSDCDSASPSTPNPVLRLMGKNLMVVNKDEDASVAFGQVQPRTQNNCQPCHYSTFLSVSSGNTQKEDHNSFHQVVPQGSAVLGQDPHKMAGQLFYGSNCFGGQSDSKLPQSPAQLTVGMFEGQHADSGTTTSMDPHGNKADYNSRRQKRLNVPPVYHAKKALTTPDPKCKHADSSTPPVKEIIIIDDIPEGETFLASDNAKFIEGWRKSPVVSSGMSIPTLPICNISRGHPFSCYHSQDHPPLGESPVVHNSSFHGTPIRLATTSPVRWGCTSEGSGVLQNSPLTAVSSSPSHLRPAVMYYSPSLS